jgi:hypothetical protein
MAQAVSHRPLTAKSPVGSQVSPSEICGGQSGTGTGSFIALVFSLVSITPPVGHTNLHIVSITPPVRHTNLHIVSITPPVRHTNLHIVSITPRVRHTNLHIDTSFIRTTCVLSL